MSKLANTFKSERQIGIGSETIEKYIGYFEESFRIEKAVRYDVKGRKFRSGTLLNGGNFYRHIVI